MRSFSKTTTSNEPLNLFISYSHKDEPLRDHLERHLATYKRNDKIQTWHDRKILPGGNWQKEIDDAINQANLILLLVSAYFIESNYCYGIEMVRAIQRHEEGDATVIPIMLAPVSGWDQTPMASLLALPTDAKPVSRWRSRDEAFFDVAQGIARIVRCRAPGKVEWKLILEGSASALPEGFSKSLESTLQDLAADASLRILNMAEGSLILGLQSSPQGYRILKALHERQELSHKIVRKVISISEPLGAAIRLEVEGQSLPSTVSLIPLPADLTSLPGPTGDYPQLRVLQFPVKKWTDLSFKYFPDEGGGREDPELTQRLGRYFNTCLVVRSEDQHVDLSPLRENCGLPAPLRRTELGRCLLQQDLELKKVTAALLHPDYKVGEEFWAALFRGCEQRGLMPLHANFRVWIVPKSASVIERMVGDDAQIILESFEPEVLCEVDSLARADIDNGTEDDDFALVVFRERVLPIIRQEVVAGKRFASLRQMLSAMVLAAWYRRKLGPYLKGFLDSNDTGKYGLDVVDPDISTIDEYLRLYKNGIWRTVRRDMSSESGVITTRTIIAGSICLATARGF